MDTGNFLEDPYDDLEAVAPYTAMSRPRPIMAAAPGTRSTSTIRGSLEILQRHNYHGYVSLEFEGKEDYRPRSPRACRCCAVLLRVSEWRRTISFWHLRTRMTHAAACSVTVVTPVAQDSNLPMLMRGDGMTQQFVLALDQGTTSSRAIVFNHQG